MTRLLQRWGAGILFLVISIGSLGVLLAGHYRMKTTLEATVTAVDNLSHARLHVAQALLAAEGVEAGDPTIASSRPVAEIDEALAMLDDFLEGRSSLLGLAGPHPVDLRLRELVSGYARELQDLSRDLASGAYYGAGPIERRLRMSRLTGAEDDIETALYDELEQRLAREELRHRLRMSAWIVVVLMAGATFVILRRSGRRQEEALHAAEGRYAALATHSGAGLVRTDEQGILVEGTPQWEEMFGAEVEAGLGSKWWHTVPGDEQGRVAESWTSQRARADSFLLDVRHRLPDDDDRYLASRWAKDTSARNGQASWVGTFIDETEQRRIEDQFRQSQKMEAIGRLAGGIAHDFNNLLTVIKGYAQFALEAPQDSGAAKDDLAQVLRAVEQAHNLTRHLLAFSRNQVIEPRVMDMGEVVRSAERLIRRLIGKHVQVESIVAPDTGHVRIDPTHAEQVLMNLAVNARDAMPEGGRFRIETDNREFRDNVPGGFTEPFSPGRYVRLRVTDTGSGMSSETRERIFEPFFTTKSPHQGTGLGLSTVFGIVKQSGGYIRVESELGVGSTFEIYLPRTDEPATPRSSEPAAPRDLTGSETLLLVEDETSVRSVVHRILEHAGYSVIEAENGQVALEIWERRAADIDLVVTDMIMPTMGGSELAARLWERRPMIPILFMSGYTEDEVMLQRMPDSRLQLLEKPFDAATLREKVRSTLDRAARSERDAG